MIFGHKASKSV